MTLQKGLLANYQPLKQGMINHPVIDNADHNIERIGTPHITKVKV